VKFQVLMFTAL